jgi:hypothetical protein
MGTSMEGSTIPELFVIISAPHPSQQVPPDLADIAHISDPEE